MNTISLSIMLSLSMLGSQSVAAIEYADTLITDAVVYADQPANTIAIKQGVITYVGNDHTGQKYLGADTEVLDMQGAMVLPGFIDNHNHVFEAASEAGGNCEVSPDANLEGQIPYLEDCAAQATEGQWLIGYGFTLELILSENNKQTPLEVLDDIFPEHPVIIMEQTSHSMWVNSAALELAGITVRSEEPQGGKYLKDPLTGGLNGILLDNAGDIVMEQAWNSLNNIFQQSYQGLQNGLAEAAANGITTIGDGRLYWKRGWFDVWKAAENNGDLTSRVSLRPWIYPQDEPEAQLEFLKKIQSRNPENLLIIDQVKMYSDGILINGTAKVVAPYRYKLVENLPFGLNYIPPEDMQFWLTKLDKINYGAHIHAIGDGAVRESLNAIEYAREQGSERDYTLTHVEMIQNVDIQRFKPLKVTADFQVGSDYIVAQDHSWAEPFIGQKRAHSLMRLRPVFDTGANLTLSSDWNVNDINPLVGIANSLRMAKTGLPDISSAIDAYTINPAISLGLDDITGSITVGKSADLVVLDEDITELPANKIADTEILMTILQGEVVFDAEE
ncbi:amidohydrolase [Aliamphritea ceti]|uniref:amidohydrolase n=1 Tax=Aliamphritea ceti TaxID=1524258 RepID=UPI0021C43D7E|nr:amidohydrolase [Aliamphritea ceti]